MRSFGNGIRQAACRFDASSTQAGCSIRSWLKDKLPSMSEDEQLALLATDGMLVKRPILVGDGFVLVGFRQEEWETQV